MATGKKVKPRATAAPKRKSVRSPATKSSKPPEPANLGQTNNGLGDPGEDRIAEFLKLSTREMVYHLLQHPEEWLDYANPKLGGKTPNELIANGEEKRVRTLLIAGAMGMF